MKKKNIAFNLSIDYLKNLWIKQNGFCELSGIKMLMPYDNNDFDLVGSIDRIEFDKGYVKGNVRFILNCINTFKGQKNDEFVYFITESILRNKDNDR